jgi:hypothetical protein
VARKGHDKKPDGRRPAAENNEEKSHFLKGINWQSDDR